LLSLGQTALVAWADMSGSGFGSNFSKVLGGSSGFGTGFYSPRATITTNGLVLQYDIGNASSYSGSGSVVTDLIGNSHATLNNSPAYSSGYLEFDGSTQYLMTNTSLASKVTTDITSISMWAYPMDNGVLLSERGEASLASGWHESQMEMIGGTIKFGMWNGTGISSFSSTIATPLNNWYNFVMVYDGTKLTAYVNAAACGSATFSRLNPIEGGTGIHYAIAGPDSTNMGDGSYANMRLGQFLVYNAALSESDILNNFIATRRAYDR
jgi:hypothetical protein